jgi:hypothetical protein
MPAEITPNTNTEIDPSTVVAADAAPAPDASQDAAPNTGGEQSPEGEKKGEDAAPKTALEAAQAVVAKERKERSAGEPQKGEPGAKPEGEKPPKVAFDDPNLPFKNHPAYKQWASEHRTLKVAKEKNEAAIAELTPKAKAHDDLIGFFESNSLNQQDVATGLSIMQAMKNNPAQAYEMLRPVYEKLLMIVGETIPADIKARVEAGEISEQAARELAQARAHAGIAQNQASAAEQRRQREQQAREQVERQGEEERTIGAIEGALNDWGKNWHARDPDAVKKQPLLEPLLEAEWVRNPPKSAEEAVRQADAVLAGLNERARTFFPTPKPKDGNLPPSGAPVNHAPVPTSSIEAARAALRG